MSEFDEFSDSYIEVNDRMLAGTGESTESLAEYKASYLGRILPADFSGDILDYGCGVGVLTRAIRTGFRDARLHGFDKSTVSIAAACRQSPDDITYFSADEKLEGNYAAIVLANVLHHVPPDDRSGLIGDVARRLAPGGRVIVFEHNPLNWFVMKILEKHPFDRDAVFLPHRESIGLLESAKLETQLDFIVFFPGILRPLDFLDRGLRWLPLGAQYACVGSRELVA